MPTQRSTVAVMAPASNDACGVFNTYAVCFGGGRVFDNEPWLTAPITGGLERVLNLDGTWTETLRFTIKRGFWGFIGSEFPSTPPTESNVWGSMVWDRDMWGGGANTGANTGVDGWGSMVWGEGEWGQGGFQFDPNAVANMIRGNATVVTPLSNSQTSDFNSYQVRFVGPQQMFSKELWTTTLINGSVQRACNVGETWNEMVSFTTRPTRPVHWVGVGCSPTISMFGFSSCGCSPIGWNPLSRPSWWGW